VVSKQAPGRTPRPGSVYVEPGRVLRAFAAWYADDARLLAIPFQDWRTRRRAYHILPRPSAVPHARRRGSPPARRVWSRAEYTAETGPRAHCARARGPRRARAMGAHAGLTRTARGQPGCRGAASARAHVARAYARVRAPRPAAHARVGVRGGAARTPRRRSSHGRRAPRAAAAVGHEALTPAGSERGDDTGSTLWGAPPLLLPMPAPGQMVHPAPLKWVPVVLGPALRAPPPKAKEAAPMPSMAPGKARVNEARRVVPTSAAGTGAPPTRTFASEFAAPSMPPRVPNRLEDSSHRDDETMRAALALCGLGGGTR
jgi:hypothetical protein